MTPKALFAASAMAALLPALEAKIPVVLLDRDLDPSGKELYLTAVTSDSAHEGEAAAGSPRA